MSPNRGTPISSPERLAYWYFRLNGFLTTENFIIHPDTGRNQRTDADLLAVRFTGRAENLIEPMEDDQRVSASPTPINIVIAEVKRGRCALNGPHTNPLSGNMNRALKAIGCVPTEELPVAADQLYQQGLWRNSLVTVRLFAIGEYRAPDLCVSGEQQIIWDEIIAFCIDRFRQYRNQKSSVGTWSNDGRQLMDDALSRSPYEAIRSAFGLRPRSVPTRNIEDPSRPS